MPQDVPSEFLDGAQLAPVTKNLWLLSKPATVPSEWLYCALVTREIIETLGVASATELDDLEVRYG